MKRCKLLALAALLLLTGCAAPGTPGQASPERHKIAMIVQTDATQFWKSIFAGAEAAAGEYNLELSISFPAQREDYEAQNRLVEQAVAEGAEAIVFSAIDYEQNAPAIDAAAEAGVQVVVIDSDVHSDKVDVRISTNNYLAGRQAAQAVLDSGLEELNVAMVGFGQGTANVLARQQGVRDVLTGKENVHIVSTLNLLSDADTVQDRIAVMIERHPETNVVVACNELTSVGAANALEAMGLADRVWMVGFDSNVHTLDLLQTGAVDALIVQNPYAMGYLGTEAGYALITGKPADQTVETAVTTVTRENLFDPDIQKIAFAFQ